MWQRVTEFFKDVRAEMSKISWPTIPELRESTVVVIVTVTILALFVGMVDWVFNMMLRTLSRTL
jgi:preprotein translocase subunit SecE